MAIPSERRIYADRVVHDGSTKYRGGQVTALSASSLTVTLHLEQHVLGTRTVSRSLAPNAALYDPVCVEVEGDGAESYTVTALHPTRFMNRWATNSAEEGFQPGRVPEHLSGDEGFVPWYRGMLNERSSPWR